MKERRKYIFIFERRVVRLRFFKFLKSSASTFEICWLRFLQTVGKILILIARTIVVEGNLPALLKDPFFFKTFRVQKKRGEGAGAPVGFFGDTGSEKRTQQVGLLPRVCPVCKSKASSCTLRNDGLSSSLGTACVGYTVNSSV